MSVSDPAPASAPDAAALAATLQRLRDAHARRVPDRAQRDADLARLRTAFVANIEAMVEAVQHDFGRRSRHEILASEAMTVLEEIDHTRRHLRAWMRPQRRRVNALFRPARAEIRHQPLGVVGILAPWNYPVNLALLPLVAAIGAGNHVMLKPSEHTPRTAAFLQRLLGEVFPAERVAVVLGEAEVGAAFSALPFDHLFFTGSTAVGRHVMAAAAAHLTPVTLELGGKSPALVAPGYPLARAAARIVAGKCFNAGQTCIAPDYVLVPRGQRDALADALMAEFAARYPRLADNPDYVGIVNARQAQRLRGIVEDATARGTAVRQYLPQGQPPAGVELVAPTLLLDPDADSAAMQQEIFGPVLPLVGYERIEDALAFIRARDRPLAFYPFDNDRARLARTLDAVVAGGVCVNDTLIHFAQAALPFGGVGPSGMGQYHGHAGFLAFTKAMPVLHQSRLNGMRIFDPPYTGIVDRLLGWIVR